MAAPLAWGKRRHVSLVVWMLTLLSGVRPRQAACTWPHWLDLSRPSRAQGLGTYEEEVSWEYQTRVTDTAAAGVNWYVTSRRLLTLTSNATLELSRFRQRHKTMWELYACHADQGNNTFLLRGEGAFRNGRLPVSTTYRCMALLPRSRFVMQWHLGPERKTPHDCRRQAAPLSPWPLVYFPVRRPADTLRVLGYQQLLQEAVPASTRGGYQMEVQNDGGAPVQCASNQYAPRLEMDCISGDGVRLLPAGPGCRRYSFAGSQGSKLHVLASWMDAEHAFHVLVPDDTRVHSFHCLRMPRQHPTRQPTLLFLHNVCRSGRPQRDDAYLTLRLRDTYSGGRVVPRVTLNATAQGSWLLTAGGRRRRVRVDSHSISFPGVGILSPVVSTAKACITPGHALRGGHTYLMITNTGQGCLSRVIQMSLLRVSDAVLLMHTTAATPLRREATPIAADRPGTTNSTSRSQDAAAAAWCRQLKEDERAFPALFRPQRPLTTSRKSPIGTGALTLVRVEKVTRVSCGVGQRSLTQYARHMKAWVEFRHPRATVKCAGELQLTSTHTWSFQYNTCTHNVPSGFVHLACLGTYDLSSDYQAIVLRRTSRAHVNSNPFLNEEYYCLLLPRRSYRFILPAVLHPAGQCDFPLAYAVYRGAVRPAAKLKVTLARES